jgi:hypothetical protein
MNVHGQGAVFSPLLFRCTAVHRFLHCPCRLVEGQVHQLGEELLIPTGAVHAA